MRGRSVSVLAILGVLSRICREFVKKTSRKKSEKFYDIFLTKADVLPRFLPGSAGSVTLNHEEHTCDDQDAARKLARAEGFMEEEP